MIGRGFRLTNQPSHAKQKGVAIITALLLTTLGVYELLLTTADIRAQIHNQVAEADIRKSAQRNGMQTLRMDGERWLKEGVTSEAELLRVTKD
jgi:type II secretory ATPase GspE/PulE/Tfp pilus assembly ATPase PilB-like protein